MADPTPFKEIRLLPNPKVLEAIGRVAVQWGALEFELDRLLFWASDPNDASAEHTLKNESIRKRCELLRDIVKREHANHPGTTSLIEFINDALALKGERDRIIHNLYAATDSTEPTSGAPSHLLLSAWNVKGKKTQDWKISSGRINITAKKINGILVQAANLQFQYGEKIGNSIRWNAWRHKSRTQD